MKVSSGNLHNVEKLVHDRRKNIQRHENELKRIDQQYQNKIKDVERKGNDDYLETLTNNNLRITQANLDRQKQLGEIADQLKNTSDRLAGEKKKLTDFHKKTQEELNFNHQVEMEDQRARYQSNIDEQAYDLSRAGVDIRRQGNADINALSNRMAKARHEQAITSEKVLDTQKTTFQRTQLANQLKYNKELYDQENLFVSEFDERQKTYEERIMSLTKQNQKKLEDLKKLQEQSIQNSQQDFLQKYQSLKKVQKEQLQNLTELAEKERERLINSSTQEKELITNKYSDSFYQPIILKPKISLKKDHYEIKIPVPEWEQSQVNLSVNKRTVKLSMTRNSAEKFDMPDGSQNKSNKTQSMVKEFQVDQIMDRKKITKEFADGVVTYKVGLA